MINKRESFLKRRLKKIYEKKYFKPFRKYADLLKEKIEESIRFELMVVISICFGISFVFYGFMNNALTKESKVPKIEYNYKAIESSAKYYIERIKSESEQPYFDEDKVFGEVFKDIDQGNAKAFVTDLDGNVLRKSSNVIEDKIDIFSVIESISNIDNKQNEGKAVKCIYPININENRMYFLYEDIPTANIKYDVYKSDDSVFALMLSFILFIILFIIITNRKMKYLDEIAVGLKKIAGGNLNYHIKEEGNDEIRKLASNINYMAEEINKKILAERNAEKTKADLITNVSHDLRTPLTSIMGYIGLVKDKRYEDEGDRDEYLNIAFNKAEKLKVLIEDLFEYTKLNNDGIKINKIRVNINEFLVQIIEELMPIFEENNLTIVNNTSKEGMYVDLDPDKMMRVFENLLTNAVKYSYKPGEIEVCIFEDKEYTTVSIKNKGQHISKEKVDKLFDRFYRVDESRNANTGGSGLGLAIAKNIVELHGGKIYAECYGENIIFNVRLRNENNDK